MIVFACRDNDIISYFDTRIVRNVVVSLISLFKLHTAIHMVLSTTQDPAVVRIVKYLADTVILDKPPNGIGKVTPGIRESLFVIGALDYLLRTLLEIDRYSVLSGIQRRLNNVIGVTFNPTKQVKFIYVIEDFFDCALDVKLMRNNTACPGILDMLKSVALTIQNELLGIIPSDVLRIFRCGFNFGHSMVVNDHTLNAVRLIITIKYKEIIDLQCVTNHLRQVGAANCKISTQ